LANAKTGTNVKEYKNRHVFRTAQANRLLLDDLNKLFTKIKRNNASWDGGTPTGARKGLSDLLVSPEVVEQIRAMAYNPINTLAPNGAAVGATSQPVTLVDPEREKVFGQGGLTEFYGISIMEILELGVGKRFNDVFDTVAGVTDYMDAGGSSSAVFAGATEEIIVGLDRTRDAMVRAIAVDSDTGSEFNLVADDQFSNRQQRIGYYGALEEGRMVLDDRALVGLIM
jgi:hypothetical protein